MLKALLAILTLLRAAWLIELTGAALIVAGVTLQWGVYAGLIVAGTALLLKAFELDARNQS